MGKTLGSAFLADRKDAKNILTNMRLGNMLKRARPVDLFDPVNNAHIHHNHLAWIGVRPEERILS